MVPTNPSTPVWLQAQTGAVLLAVVVVPRSSRTRVVDVYDNRLKIQLAAPPVDGKANQALVDFLAKALAVARAQIEIVGGASSRRKTVRIAGVTPSWVNLKLSPSAIR